MSEWHPGWNRDGGPRTLDLLGTCCVPGLVPGSALHFPYAQFTDEGTGARRGEVLVQYYRARLKSGLSGKMWSVPGTISAASGLGTVLGLLAHLQPQTARERRSTPGSSRSDSLHLLRPFQCRRWEAWWELPAKEQVLTPARGP